MTRFLQIARKWARTHKDQRLRDRDRDREQEQPAATSTPEPLLAITAPLAPPTPPAEAPGEELDMLNRMDARANSKCYSCGKYGHFASSCPTQRDAMAHGTPSHRRGGVEGCWCRVDKTELRRQATTVLPRYGAHVQRRRPRRRRIRERLRPRAFVCVEERRRRRREKETKKREEDEEDEGDDRAHDDVDERARDEISDTRDVDGDSGASSTQHQT